MTSIEFIIIYALAGLFVGLFILYRAIDRVRRISVHTAKAVIKFADLMYQMGDNVQSHRKAMLEILKVLESVADNQEKEFKSIKHSIAAALHIFASPPPDK